VSTNQETKEIIHKKPVKRKKRFFILATLFLIAIFILLLCHHCPKPTPPLEVWFEEYFEHGLEDWESLDAKWIDNDGVVHNTSARVAKEVYLAPYLGYEFNTPIHNDQIVVEFYTKIEKITGAMTLASLDFPSGEISAVISKDGYLGVAFGLFEPARYSTKRLTPGEWQKVQIYVNNSENKLSLRYNDSEVLNTHWAGTLPLMKIWLGSVWIYGAENYVPTLGSYYDAIRVGNLGLLDSKTPKSSRDGS
jgi:hypothetical protein